LYLLNVYPRLFFVKEALPLEYFSKHTKINIYI